MKNDAKSPAAPASRMLAGTSTAKVELIAAICTTCGFSHNFE